MTASPFTETTMSARNRAFDELSAAGPVQHVTLFTGMPVWLITGYAEARQVLTSPHVVKFSTAIPHAAQVPSDEIPWTTSHMLFSNPPDHTRLRRLASTVFTRKRVEALAPRIAEISSGLLDGLAASDSPVDLVAGYSYPLPITVITELVGVPGVEHDEFRELSTVMINAAAYPAETYLEASRSMIALVRRMIEQRRAAPTGDLLSDLVAVREGVDRLTDKELVSMVVLLLIAGHETTVNLLTNSVYALLTHPEQLAKLRSDHDLIPAAVEEVLRYDSPVMATFPARTNAPLQVGEVTIPAGELVIPVISTTNRDPARFESPAELDITREANQHIAFGHGIHHCLGAPLARLEARIALGHLLDRFPGLRLAEPEREPARFPSLIVNGISELPVFLA